jgi:TusA-related sulfurtransferase
MTNIVKKMQDVQVGERFTVAGTEYIKTNEIRVSCCKAFNCEVVGNADSKTYFSPEMDVNG